MMHFGHVGNDIFRQGCPRRNEQGRSAVRAGEGDGSTIVLAEHLTSDQEVENEHDAKGGGEPTDLNRQ